MIFSFQNLYNVRNYFFSAYFTGRKLKCRHKGDFSHGYREPTRTRTWVFRALSLCFFSQTTLLPFPIILSFPQNWRQKKIRDTRNIVGSLSMSSNLRVQKLPGITLHIPPILVYLHFFSYNNLVIYTEYICRCKNTCLHKKCMWRQWWFLVIPRQLLQVLCVCVQNVTYTET